MHGNLCKHQIVIILMVIDITQEDDIEYYGTWCGFNYDGLPAMFVNPKHIFDNSNFEDDGFIHV